MALKADKDGLTVLTHDGSLSTLSAEGKLKGSKPLDANQTEQAGKDMASAPDQAADKAAKAQARPDRMLKLAASHDGQVAVAYWGGTLRLVDGTGQIRSEQQLPQDITALAWVNGKVVARLANGQVVALPAK